MGIIVKKDDIGTLGADERGKTANAGGKLRIIVRDMPIPKK